MNQAPSSTRSTIFRKIISLKTKQKIKIDRLRRNIKQIEKTNISATELSKLPKNRILRIQEQQKRIAENILTEASGIKQMSRAAADLQIQYLKMSS